MIFPTFKLSSLSFCASYNHRTTASVRGRLGRRKREEAVEEEKMGTRG